MLKLTLVGLAVAARATGGCSPRVAPTQSQRVQRLAVQSTLFGGCFDAPVLFPPPPPPPPLLPPPLFFIRHALVP